MSVARTNTTRSVQFSRQQRFWLIAAAVGLAATLVVARVLRPEPSGYGTHQQLGLPPCTFTVMFNRPCPTCGMTTAWAFLVRGELTAALRTNAAGALLAMAAFIGIPWLLISAACGRWLPGTPRSGATAFAAVVLMLIALVQWGWRLLAG